MIEVSVKIKGRHEIARMRIENLEEGDDSNFGNYAVEIAVDNCNGEMKILQRSFFHFPRTKLNALALILQALNTLEEKEFYLEPSTDSSDLARRQRGTLPPLQLR